MHAKTQFDNVGDALIVGQAVALMSEHMNVVLSAKGIPAHFSEQIRESTKAPYSELDSGKAEIFLALALRRMHGLRSFYSLIPGGINGEKSTGSYLSGIVYNLALRIMSLFGIVTVQMGVSYDKLGVRHQKLVRGRARALSYHFVRDSQTDEYCRERGITHSGVAPDLAFLIFPDASEKASGRRLAFSFRTDRGGRALIEKIGRMIAASFAADTDIVLVSQVARDTPGMLELQEFLSSLGMKCDFEDVTYSLDAASKVYSTCSVIYSNRLHALLLAASNGVAPCPVISAQVDRKISGIFLDLGNCISIELDSWNGTPLPQPGLEYARAFQKSALMMKSRIKDVTREIFH
ncbi:polysaccharide pyruvyl transferase family protein [Stenotrophomonas sp. S39]|uniref:polysaccharide pyruvyl transferase family protein n=1 Tax=Stenotrophomonas sp. S39 TaxID=2767451 RepID=UPI00190D28E2|nr:polysaccharide pyruvyl transferase family protein [Stenotrophomonas sp. S39]MBK0053475.1 polysaccharide pyruvyl transferase family protein [Stenotrophomonas sp. S39]